MHAMKMGSGNCLGTVLSLTGLIKIEGFQIEYIDLHGCGKVFPSRGIIVNNLAVIKAFIGFAGKCIGASESYSTKSGTGLTGAYPYQLGIASENASRPKHEAAGCA